MSKIFYTKVIDMFLAKILQINLSDGLLLYLTKCTKAYRVQKGKADKEELRQHNMIHMYIQNPYGHIIENKTAFPRTLMTFISIT